MFADGNTRKMLCGLLYEQATKCNTASGSGLLLAIKGHLEGRQVYDGCDELWQVADVFGVQLEKLMEGPPEAIKVDLDESPWTLKASGSFMQGPPPERIEAVVSADAEVEALLTRVNSLGETFGVKYGLAGFEPEGALPGSPEGTVTISYPEPEPKKSWRDLPPQL